MVTVNINTNTTRQTDNKTLAEKLVSSKEEESWHHLHKILGFSCLASFVYRFTYGRAGEYGFGFGPHYGTLVFVLHHFLLNASSFIFDIPHRRIRDGGFRIWPEYRIHSLVFTSRSLACMLVLWYEQSFGQLDDEPDSYCWANLLIVLGTCAAADYGTWIQGEFQGSTVRGTTMSDPFETWFASEMQFFLTSFCLIGLDGRYTPHLLGVAIIQGNSFLMTLRRKNVAPQYVLTATYTAMLILGFWIVILDDLVAEKALVNGTFAGLAIVLRMGPLHLNKYLLWTILGLAWMYIRHTRILPIYNSEFWLVGFVTTKLIALALGLRKRHLQTKAPKSSFIFQCVIISHILLVFHMGITWYLVFRDYNENEEEGNNNNTRMEQTAY